MKAATVREIKQELGTKSEKELVELCLTLSKFKKENKELLTYLLYEAQDEAGFISGVKSEMDEAFEEINTRGYYLVKKSVRKILRTTKKYIRYSKNKETEVALLLHFCYRLKTQSPSYRGNAILVNTYNKQIQMIQKGLSMLHEDIQYDYAQELEDLEI